MATPGQRAHFRLFGFPVHIGWGFIAFMLLIAMPRGGNGSFGLWLAVGLIGFTLVHELGHATVARWAGAEAGISLEFMAGYTSYRPTRPIPRAQTVAITLAGPVVHIASGVAVLLAMGVNPLSNPSSLDSDAALAIWWAGPLIGVLNLIPLLPLDGGNVVTTLLEAVAPKSAHRVMLYASLAVTAAAMVSTAFVERARGFTIFIAFLLISQLAGVAADRSRAATSPFDAAAAAMRAGNQVKAVRLLTRGLSRPSPHRLVPAELSTSPDGALLAAINALPRPLPRGNVWNEYVLASLLVRYGAAHEAAAYAAECYHEEPSPLAATAVARAAASLSDAATAAGWLRAAHDAGLPSADLHKLVRVSPEFAGVRTSAEVQSLLAAIGPAPTLEPRRT